MKDLILQMLGRGREDVLQHFTQVQQELLRVAAAA